MSVKFCTKYATSVSNNKKRSGGKKYEKRQQRLWQNSIWNTGPLGGELGVWANDFWHRVPGLPLGLFWNFHVEFVMCQYDLNTEKILLFRFFPYTGTGTVTGKGESCTTSTWRRHHKLCRLGSALMDFDKVAKGENLQYGTKFMQIRLWPKLARKFVRLGAFHFRSGSLAPKRNTLFLGLPGKHEPGPFRLPKMGGSLQAIKIACPGLSYACRERHREKK